MLEKSYLLLSLFMLSSLLVIYSRAISKFALKRKEKLNEYLKLVIPLALWFFYVVFLSESEVLFVLDLPPRFPLLVLLPIIIVYVFFYIKNKENKFIHTIPKPITIGFQSFRIFVETLILYTFFKGILPVAATFEGLNFDILIGITAPIIAYLVYKQKYLGLVKAWNVLGIFMILFVTFIVGSSIYAPQIWNSSEILVDFNFLKLPYLLLPTFLAPLGIFLHIVSLIQLRK